MGYIWVVAHIEVDWLGRNVVTMAMIWNGKEVQRGDEMKETRLLVN